MRSWGKKDGEEGAADGADGEDGERKERLPKKKMAVLFGYNGIGYSGSQM
jgi:tRNA pseudouridine38-40 synthase